MIVLVRAPGIVLPAKDRNVGVQLLPKFARKVGPVQDQKDIGPAPVRQVGQRRALDSVESLAGFCPIEETDFVPAPRHFDRQVTLRRLRSGEGPLERRGYVVFVSQIRIDEGNAHSATKTRVRHCIRVARLRNHEC